MSNPLPSYPYYFLLSVIRSEVEDTVRGLFRTITSAFELSSDADISCAVLDPAVGEIY